jgi:hypothetical protein
VPPIRQHPDDEKEPAGGDAVREHLIHGPCTPFMLSAQQAEHHEAEVATDETR